MTTVLLEASVISRTEHRKRDLAGVLARLNIPVIPTNQVRQFQEEYGAAAVKSRLLQNARSFRFAMVGVSIIMALAILASAHLSMLLVGTMMLGGAILYLLRRLHTSSDRFIERELQWWQFDEGVGNFTSDIPLLTRKRMRRIRNHLPAVEFYTDRFQLDPFMWATHKDQEYCIGHWGEPFEDR